MDDFNLIADGLPWLLSAITVVQMRLAGMLHRHAWIIMLSNQSLWLTWIIATGTWGLLPMNIALWYVGACNQLGWKNRIAAVKPDNPTR